jgi:prepilin-type N-terminal cleavage/methylation domain-containing protein
MNRMLKPHRKNNEGFTLVELMIATMIFSMVLVVLLASFLQIARMFYKGVSISSTNEAARSLIEEVVNDVRFSSASTACDPTAPLPNGCPNNKKYFCIGNHRYTYVLTKKVTSTDVASPTASSLNAGIMQDTVNSCLPPISASDNGTNPRQLLGLNMQLNEMEFKPADNGVLVHAHVLLYGADSNVFASYANPAHTPAEALVDPDAHCSGNLLDTQLCATADFQTIVSVRN